LALAKMRSFGSLREFAGGGPGCASKPSPPPFDLFWVFSIAMQIAYKGIRVPATAKHCFFQKKALTKLELWFNCQRERKANGRTAADDGEKAETSGKLKSGNPDFCRRQCYRLKTNSSEI